MINIFYLIKPYWKYGKLYLFGKIAVTIICAPLLALIEVTLTQAVIDAITTGKTLKETLLIAAIYQSVWLGVTLIRWVFLILYDRWKAVDIQNKINRGIYEQAILTDYKYFDDPQFYNDYTFTVSEYAAKSTAALDLLLQVCGIVSVVIAMTTYLALLGPWVILFAVLGSAVYMFAQSIIGKLGIARTKESVPHDRKLSYIHRVSYLKQYAADLKTSLLNKTILKEFDKSGGEKVGVFKKYAVPNTWANILFFAAYFLFDLVILLYLIVSAFTKELSVGAITGLFTAAKRLHGQLTQFVELFGKALELSLYAEKVREFFNLKSKIETQVTGAEPSNGSFALELKNVSFTYPKSDFSLRNINISVASNEKIAIIGENGAGKTTLSKLLLRLYDVDSGDILYNGKSIREYDIHKLRLKIGVAFQEPQIYGLTVRKNMEVYNTAEDSALREVLEKVGLNIELDDEVTREFDENGVMLSGGQSQKLALARLLYGEFGLLLLDEPSSALDPLAEYKMTKLIFEQSKTTTIMVAHRLSTIRDADCIYLIDSGGIAEKGTHSELMNMHG
ncbi:MAG: ABC transporter ATP-binding protein/permease, partial [Oscillospiraceae bacterium]|nr:ABC transporter ATP-binding protein/permease [Oscillospiraceae bacterium]